MKLNSPRRFNILGCKFSDLNTSRKTSLTTKDAVMPAKGAKFPILRSFLINFLTPKCDGLSWHYVLLGEAVFFDWRGKSERLTALCDFARVRHRALVDSQQRLDWD